MLTDPVSIDALKATLQKLREAAFAAWNVLDPRSWAEGVRRMPRRGGGTLPFSFRFAPYQLEMFLALFQETAQEVVFMLFSRGGKSEVVLNALGYWIAEVPSSIFVMWPTLGQAKKWSKDNLQRELIDPTPALSTRVGDGAGRRKSDNTLLHKLFDGGLIDMVGAASPGDIRRAKGNRLYADEIDAVVEIQSDEGDQLKQFKGRGDEFPDTREVYCSYPSLKGKSRIEAKLIESDLRQWVVKCLVCGGEVIMHRTGGDHFNDGIKRTRLVFDEEKPEGAYLECPHRKCRIDDRMRHAMMMGGDPANPRFDLWRPTRPFRGKVGFHANSLLWPHPVDRAKFAGGYLHKLAQDMIDVEKSDNPERSKRVLVNRVDAETYEAPSDMKPEHSTLFLRREDYTPATMLPKGVLWIAFGCDVQGSALNPKNEAEKGGRLEMEIIGYGENDQTWGLGYYILNGSPMVPPSQGVWAELDRILETTTFPHPSGKVLRISGGLIDRGHKPDHVLAFTRPRARRGIFASFGSSQLARPIIRPKPTFLGNPRAKCWELGTNEAKDQIYQRLERDNRTARGFMHYPQQGCYSEQYFKGLVAENSSMERASDGAYYKHFVCDEGVRNEPLDIRVMSLAIVRILKPKFEKLALEMAEPVASGEKAPPTPPTPAQPAKATFGPSRGFSGGKGFATGWKR